MHDKINAQAIGVWGKKNAYFTQIKCFGKAEDDHIVTSLSVDSQLLTIYMFKADLIASQ